MMRAGSGERGGERDLNRRVGAVQTRPLPALLSQPRRSLLLEDAPGCVEMAHNPARLSADGRFSSYVTTAYATPPSVPGAPAPQQPAHSPALCSGGHLSALKQSPAPEGGPTADSGKSIFVKRARFCGHRFIAAVTAVIISDHSGAEKKQTII